MRCGVIQPDELYLGGHGGFREGAGCSAVHTSPPPDIHHPRRPTLPRRLRPPPGNRMSSRSGVLRRRGQARSRTPTCWRWSMHHTRSSGAHTPRLALTVTGTITCFALVLLAACNADRLSEAPATRVPSAPVYSSSGGPVLVVNVSNDTTAQNETPLAVNPLNPDNLL